MVTQFAWLFCVCFYEFDRPFTSLKLEGMVLPIVILCIGCGAWWLGVKAGTVSGVAWAFQSHVLGLAWWDIWNWRGHRWEGSKGSPCSEHSGRAAKAQVTKSCVWWWGCCLKAAVGAATAKVGANQGFLGPQCRSHFVQGLDLGWGMGLRFLWCSTQGAPWEGC